MGKVRLALCVQGTFDTAHTLLRLYSVNIYVCGRALRIQEQSYVDGKTATALYGERVMEAEMHAKVRPRKFQRGSSLWGRG